MARLSHPATSLRHALRNVFARLREADPANPARGNSDGKPPSRKQGKETQGINRSLQQAKVRDARCTYPAGPSVVMMGFRPSFFLFLFIAELPLADAAGDGAPGGGFCATDVSLVCCAPFIVRKGEIDR
jgi:hypothetical protein